MPGNTSYQLYDLTPLEPQLEAGQLVLTPNFRLARRIKSEWDRRQIGKGRRTWRPVQVHALESWLLQCWQHAADAGQVAPRVRLDALQARELWTRIVEADASEDDQYNLLQAGAAAELAQEARDTLLRWQVDFDATAIRSAFSLDADCATFSRWLTAFEAQLASRGLATAADCLVELLYSEFSPGVDRAVLVDFDDVQPLQQACLERLAAAVSRHSSSSGQASCTVYSYPDREAELAAAAGWACRRQRESPGETTTILLTDMANDRATIEYLLRREFDCLGENYASLPVNFSTGISLDRAPVIRDALRVLATCTDEMPMSGVLGLFTSRFIPRRDEDQQKSVTLLRRLYEDGSQRVSLARLRQAAQAISCGGTAGILLGEAMRDVDALRLRRRRSPPSAWVEPFCQILDTWGWPGDIPLDSLEYQQVEHWYTALETFGTLDGVCGELDLPAALALLQRHCQGQVSQPQTIDSNIQVLGPLEAAGLHFDAIWLCGLEGSRWPAPARPNPFIPVGLQRRLDMPHASAEREWLYAESLMRQYRGNCREMITSYARQAEGVPELPSPLLDGFEIEHREGTPDLPRAWLEQQRGRLLEAVTDEVAPAIGAAELEGLRGGSGIVQDQASCPFRSFVRHRLGAEPLEDYFAGLSAAQRGTLLHNALYILWGDIGDSASLQGMDTPQLSAAVERAAISAVDELPGGLRHHVGMACLDLERQRLQALLAQWLEVERERPPFTVSSREQNTELSLGALKLQLRVDRIDTLPGGETLVIDYKSGRHSVADWLGERPAQPQLPLYSMATQVNGIAFAQVRNRECKLLGLAEMEGVPGVNPDIEKAVKRRSDAGDWQGLCEEWQRNLERLAQEFIAGAAAVEPLPGACKYCGLDSLCRVAIPVEDERR